ncbi:unnamed protein product [Hymenolepis diminuta]|uniref:Uncharacterized protein n=1 Tax=Hymenolepis diminuta TaxID=6216 RepID=A0A0R3SGV6_HYMDI|nr:unnamed protein product [Hymenolepis diminuta]
MDSIKIAKIKAIVRTIMGQLKLSKPDRAPENYIKNVGEFHHESSVSEVFATWCAWNWNVNGRLT